MLWGGRFSQSAAGLAREFGDSIGFDVRLATADVVGSIAYARALVRTGLITAGERESMIEGLGQVRAEFEAGTFVLQPGDEDVHTAVERRLGELIGPAAGKLHTGRSRNDQVATDLRLYLLGESQALGSALYDLQAAIVDKAEAHMGAVMPGYTHLQQAQPVLFSHWLMSVFWKLERDAERLADVARHTSVLPLGAGALAGHPFGLDRQALAADLGLVSVAQNSIDAVSDRDFCVEFLAWAALVQVHLSSLAEDLVTWSSREFGLVQIDDAYATGSSLMPQKRNPDVLELMRGKSGRVIGHLVALLTTLKGLPSGYNKDLQEDKQALFDAVDTLALELPLAAAVIRSLRVDEARMAAAVEPAALATDLADYLVRQGVPFRQAHHLVGQAVKRAEALGLSLATIGLHEYRQIHLAFGPDLYQVFDVHRSVSARDAEGGTAPAAVRVQIARAKELLAVAQPTNQLTNQ